MVAVQDRNKHNEPIYAYGICKVFIICEVIGGEFKENIETTEIDYFDLFYRHGIIGFIIFIIPIIYVLKDIIKIYRDKQN